MGGKDHFGLEGWECYADIKGALTFYTDTAEFTHECMHEFSQAGQYAAYCSFSKVQTLFKGSSGRSRHLPLSPQHLPNSVRTWARTAKPRFPAQPPADKITASVVSQMRLKMALLAAVRKMSCSTLFLAVCMKWLSSIKVGIWLITESNRQPGLPVMSICLSVFIKWSSCELGKQYLLGDFR